MHYPVKMKLAAEKLESFRAWLIGRGRLQDTAKQYLSILRLVDEDDLLAPLRDTRMSPNTLARNKAALACWARFVEDPKLVAAIKDFSIPAARRVTVKVPLTKAEWQRLVKGIESDHEVSPAIRSVIALMAIRGFRVGDVLRIRRKEAQAALRTGIISFEGKKRVRVQYDVSNFREYFQKLLDEGPWDTVANIVSDRAVKDPQKSARHAISVGFKKVGVNAGFNPKELYPHRLRRSYATYYLEAVGFNLEKLRQHMGWANVATAAKYVDHIDQKALDSTAQDMIHNLMNPVDKTE